MKLGLVGARGHWNYVFEALPKLPHVQVVAICPGYAGEDVTCLEHAAGKHGAPPRSYQDFPSLLAGASVDALSICGPFERHASMCMAAFKRGIHVFCEKPAALTLEDLDQMRSVHAGSGVHFATMMGLRFDPAFMTAWQLVHDGAIGIVRLLSARKSYKLGQRPDYYRDRNIYGGTIPWVGSHAVDWIYWFSGNAAFRSVSALHSRNHNASLGDCEITAVLQFAMDQEMLATATLDYLRPTAAATHGDDHIRVAGTDGIIHVQDSAVKLLTSKGEQSIPLQESPSVFEDFVRNVEHPDQAILRSDDVWSVTEACLLARQAADEHSMIPFPSRAG